MTVSELKVHLRDLRQLLTGGNQVLIDRLNGLNPPPAGTIAEIEQYIEMHEADDLVKMHKEFRSRQGVKHFAVFTADNPRAIWEACLYLRSICTTENHVLLAQ
jgi:hypothetical protein